jgi:hypothetical protein
MPSATGTLRLVTAQGTQRYALLDKVISGGDILELCCSGGWITGRFEWDTGPTFFFSIEVEGGKVAQQSLPLPDGALLRWPDGLI